MIIWKILIQSRHSLLIAMHILLSLPSWIVYSWLISSQQSTTHPAKPFNTVQVIVVQL